MSFDVLANKVVSGEVTRMEWCPTMDLLALVTADSSLMVHRPGGWQRLFVHTGFDHPITCLAWQPDGQVLAVGHADGSVTLFGVEDGDTQLKNASDRQKLMLRLQEWLPLFVVLLSVGCVAFAQYWGRAIKGDTCYWVFTEASWGSPLEASMNSTLLI